MSRMFSKTNICYLCSTLYFSGIFSMKFLTVRKCPSKKMEINIATVMYFAFGRRTIFFLKKRVLVCSNSPVSKLCIKNTARQ